METTCAFCQIAEGQITCHKMFENDYCVAFMDKHPINPGHVLVIPKMHIPDFYDLPEKEYTELMLAVKQVAQGMELAVKPKKVGLIVAGFDVLHAHIHVIPMLDYHDITSKSLLEGKRSNPSSEELESMAKKLKKEIK